MINLNDLSKGLHIRDGDWYMYEHGLQRINMIKVINIFLREKITLPCILKLFHRIVFFFLKIMINGF